MIVPKVGDLVEVTNNPEGLRMFHSWVIREAFPFDILKPGLVAFVVQTNYSEGRTACKVISKGRVGWVNAKFLKIV